MSLHDLDFEPQLRRQGYRDPDCACRIESLGPFGHPQVPEIVWNPRCPIHEHDICGTDYEPVTGDGETG